MSTSDNSVFSTRIRDAFSDLLHTLHRATLAHSLELLQVSKESDEAFGSYAMKYDLLSSRLLWVLLKRQSTGDGIWALWLSRIVVGGRRGSWGIVCSQLGRVNLPPTPRGLILEVMCSQLLKERSGRVPEVPARFCLFC